MPKIFGIEHILFMLIMIIIGIITLIIAKKKITTDDSKRKFFMCLGFIGLFFILATRISVCFNLYNKNFWYLIPETFCGTNSLVLSLVLIFGKKNNIFFHILWLFTLLTCGLSFIYPTYIGQNESIFYPSTIFSLFHHAITLFNVIAILVLGYMEVSYKKAWVQLFYLIYALCMGHFMIYVLKFNDAFYLKEPLMAGLKFWVMFPLYLVFASLVFALIELFKYLKKKKIS